MAIVRKTMAHIRAALFHDYIIIAADLSAGLHARLSSHRSQVWFLFTGPSVEHVESGH